MAKLNTNGNAYTIIYAAVIVVIVAFLLAFVASALKPTQDDNVAIDKKQQILSSLNIRGVEKSAVDATYKSVIVNDAIYGTDPTTPTNNGEAKDQAGFKVEGKNITPDNRPFYVAEVDGAKKYVIPVTGAGIWGGLWGYVALNEDCETVYGTYFSHESETAGLGARITEQWFQDSFQGKKLYAEGNEDVVLSVVKKGKEGSMSPDNYVNGVTGATLTSNGVNDMIQEDLKSYQDILKAQKK